MKKIVFFNYKNRGDVFLSRSFVQDIMQSAEAEFYYSHCWGEYLLKDLNLKYIPLDQIPKVQDNNEHAHNFTIGDTVYINTWIGKYANIVTPGHCECTLKTLYSLVYSQVFNFLSQQLNLNLQLKPIEYYLGCKIDYSYYNTTSVDNFLEIEKRKKVLFCNGPCLSGQCDYTGDLSGIIDEVSKIYSNIMFITTHDTKLCRENIKYTGDIIGNSGQDLYEISYLSKFCDFIIGRYSGPFIFTNVIVENIFDQSKKFLCFGARATDCHPYQMTFDSEFVFEQFSSLDNLKKTILHMI